MVIKLFGKNIFQKINLVRLYTSSGIPKMSSGDIGVPLSKVTAALEDFAPQQLSEKWDNTGLLVEPYTAR